MAYESKSGLLKLSVSLQDGSITLVLHMVGTKGMSFEIVGLITGCHHTNLLDDCVLVVYSVLLVLIDYQNSHSCKTGRPRAAIM